MRRFLWFNVKEPFEKLTSKILIAQENKTKIEFTGTYLRSVLNQKQMDRYILWMQDSKSWLQPHTYKETDLYRLQQSFPKKSKIEITMVMGDYIEDYFIFDFTE